MVSSLLRISQANLIESRSYGENHKFRDHASHCTRYPLSRGFSHHPFWVDYDKEADVLYISFERPQKATDTEMTDDGLLLRYRKKQLVGLTVLEASTRVTT